ncbi:hypothetical protein NLJ89_g7660 [Agrocybe chaxingu]|uniref:Structural maintenance of chromosomes protein 5 n=1 Tax=Agrocybe chaxingu TaxID=84603 RepID=A0A9W8JWX4_9AGAR|nr:hypothetical protein NLJ89_g7660 [Agrocybe chaxingu]
MIIGPNGTGKSSIACAIALGLNFSPQILGRSNELNSYVKNGTSSGYIEIELKGPKGKPNLVIRRNISSASKSSSFSLNGHSATGAEIKTKMNELNVQVGNLCSFLPQDRVSEFAAMTPQELLRETQLAAGDPNLTKWHQTLIAAGKDLRALQQTIKTEEDSLKQMKERNEGIERDVQRYKERKRIERAIELLQLLVPVARYREIREHFLEAKEVQRKWHERVKILQERNAPAHELLKRYAQDYKNAEKERDHLKKKTQEKFKQLKQKSQASLALEQEAQNLSEQLATVKDEEKARVKQIRVLEGEVQRWQEELAKPPPQGLASDEEIKQASKELQDLKRAVGEKIEDFNEKIRVQVNIKADHSRALEHAQKALAAQNNVDVQKLEMMKKWDRDVADAIVWVRENRHKFKMEVFETPFMRMAMKNNGRNFTNQVEACISSGQMRTLVAQCKEDVDTLNHFINDEACLGRKVRVTTWWRAHQPETLIPPPMSREELKEQNFDGYALDYLEYPPGLEWYLTKELNLHRTAVALNTRIDVNRVMEIVARPSSLHPGGANFVFGSTMNIVSRSRYGRKAVSNLTRDVPNARNLTAPSIDPAVKQRLDEALAQASTQLSLAEEAIKELKQAMSALDPEKKICEQKEERFKEMKEEKMKEAKRLGTAKTKLSSKQGSLAALRKAPSAEQKQKKLQKQLISNAEQRMEFAKDYTILIHNIIHEQQRCTLVGLKYLQIAANKTALQELCDRKDEKYQTALKEYNAANERFQHVKERSKELRDMSRHILDGVDDDVRDAFENIENPRLQYDSDLKKAMEDGTPLPSKEGIDFRTADELEAELETQRAELEMNMNTNPGVVEQYEKRKRDIEQLEAAVAEKKNREEKTLKQIKNAKDNWHPALQKLVNSIGAKFSAAFDRIGCAGEICISENEDYEKWAIDILVKFRDSEKLQLLTAHRQSGGERSLTTILYLMSLTEEARAPFSLVDEINQGMDQRAERVVHNSMVNVTCQPDSAQYFLITPKLLPDLEYHERMKILCVNNGEWLPEERNLSGRMCDMIDGYLARQKGSRSAKDL